MRRVLNPLALVAACVVLASCNQQDVRTAAACSPVVDRTQGSVTLNLACTAEITPTQLQQITDAVRAGQAIPPELLERSERLAQRLGHESHPSGFFLGRPLGRFGSGAFRA